MAEKRDAKEIHDGCEIGFSQVNLTVSPAEANYTGQEIKPTAIGTLTANGKAYTLDSSEYTVAYSGNLDVGSASAKAKGSGKARALAKNVAVSLAKKAKMSAKTKTITLAVEVK